jgi:hypothetical protein
MIQKLPDQETGPTSGILYLAPESYDKVLSRFSLEELNQMDADQRRHFPPPNRKTTLWRYLETYKFEDLLNTQTLFLSQVAKLAADEPNEGRMNQLQEEALSRELSHDQNKLEEFRAFHLHVRQCSWVTCFSIGEFDAAHMWERFCRQTPNEGVAIKTSYEKLQMSIAHCCTSPALKPFCAKVRYEESAYMPWKHGYLLFQKAPEFSDEREVRVCMLLLENNYPADFLRVPVSLPHLVQRIYVHPKASDSYKQHVCELARKHLPRNQWLVRWSCLR